MDEPSSIQAKPEEMLSDDERLRLAEERRKRREALLTSGIDQKARDPEYVAGVVKRLEKQMEDYETTSYAPSSIDAYSRFRENNPRGSEKLMEIVNKYPLVDLGSGEFGSFASTPIHNKKILVDKYNRPMGVLQKQLYDWDAEKFVPKPRPDVFDTTEVDSDIFYSRRDILEFLADLPDEYGNITMNNIDEEVINDQEYIRLIASQIERVLPPDGVFMSSWYHLMRKALLERGFTEVTEQFLVDDNGRPVTRGDIEIFRKPIDLVQEKS